ncbi:rRNA maturation RNase YbeY [Candidatus Erwinia haradaeae]|uniref:Endoribonuclease YbeY n=1 Tax=Candidatus Erwinia haradaeae TaxID=1922217 RepID=A0A803FTR5_9GAMM|nr:rRNA maturation RNase YbeY [Candidatus Erwinia haradaeae]VFP88173.1 Endoribonuclease YbeY [Candidatus Erwinia haradaeae]
MILNLQLACKNKKNLPTESDFYHWLTVMCVYFHPEKEITIRVVDIKEMILLNHKFCGKDTSTNVLSFPFENIPGTTFPLLGDIIICRQVVELESSLQYKALTAHWAHMTIHGALHLLGYNHVSENEALIMQSIEVKSLMKLGYPDPYISEK